MLLGYEHSRTFGSGFVCLEASHFHTMAIIQTSPSSLFGANFAYIKLNMPTPCPPRSTVPVNRPFLQPVQVMGCVFGHKFGKACDFPNDVRRTVAIFAFTLPAAIRFPFGSSTIQGSRGQVCTLNIRKRVIGNCSISERQ